jgi:hypothetical protein
MKSNGVGSFILISQKNYFRKIKSFCMYSRASFAEDNKNPSTKFRFEKYTNDSRNSVLQRSFYVT